MLHDVVVLGDEKGARRQGGTALRDLGGDAISVTDSIEVELIGPNINVEIGGGQAADDPDIDEEVHEKQPTLNRAKVAVEVLFTEAGATQLITAAFYVQNISAGTLDFLFVEEQTATAGSSKIDGKFAAEEPLDFPTRGGTLFEIRRAAPSTGQTEVRAWPY